MDRSRQSVKRQVIRNIVSFIQRPRHTQVLIASYPKSGSTWLRQITFFILYGKLPDDIATFDRIAPEIGKSANIWNSKIVKTHWAYSAAFGRAKRLYIVRKPDAVFRSFYDYRQHVVGDSYSDFEEFFWSKNGLPEYLLNLSSWRRDAGKLLLDYDDLVQDFERSIRRITAYLEIEIGSAQLQGIREATSRESMQERFRVSGFQYDFSNIGGTERYALSVKDKEVIRQYALPAYEDIVAEDRP